MNIIEYIPYERYHKIANQLFKELNLLDNNKLPFDIELIINKLNIDIIPKKELKKNFDVYGLVVKKISGFDIFIDYDHYMDDRQELYFRFTLAEELSHIILHAKIFDEAHDLESVIKITRNLSDSDYRRMEQQARVLAGCILLPAYILDNFVLDYVEKHLDSIKKFNFWQKEELADHIAEKIHKDLKLSKYVVSKIISGRYPNLLIDKILNKFGSNTFLK